MAAGPGPPDRVRAARAGAGRLGDGPDHDGRRDAGSDRRLRRAMKMKRPTPAEVSELADTMLSHARRVPTDVDRHRHRRRRRHRGRRRQHRQPVHDGRDRGGRRGRAGGQARQPRGVVAVRRGRHAGGPRGAHRPGARRGGALRRRGRHRVLLRAGVPSVVPVRRCGAARDRGADGLQSAWAAYQSGRAAGRADRLRVRRPGRGDGRGVRRAPLQRAGGARRRRPRRADHHHDVDDLAGAGRHHRPADVRPGRIRVSPAPSLSELVGGDAEANAAEARSVFGGATGPVRDAVVLNAAGAMVAHAGLSSRAEWLPAWEDGLVRAAGGDRLRGRERAARALGAVQPVGSDVAAPADVLLGGQPRRARRRAHAAQAAGRAQR